jgi:5-(carboxyamino)imidazole ribonucleotide mutase
MEMLEKFGVEHEAHVLSAHRTPDKVAAFVKGARDAGFGVLIAAAGLAAHLAGAVAANTTLPVIGIPLAGGALNGVDSLYSTVQMPTGIPVATVAINGAANAGILAVEILALGDEELTKKLAEYREELANR